MSMLSPSVASSPLASPTAPGEPRSPAAQSSQAFARVWARVMPATDSQVEVQRGDTLIGLVKAHHRQQGLPISEALAYRLAHQVAGDNGIDNPNLIHPGQRIDFGRLQLPALARGPDKAEAPAQSTASALASRHWQTPSPVPARLSPGDISAGEHPVLDRTLERALAKGFLPGRDLPAVRERILTLAERYRFDPDDFARLSLMESGGMNPQASNGRCHGIIQFCDGPARGAASVGYRNNPREILGLNLLQQLDLVDKYFSQAGLGQGPERIGLDDLYLTVLTPAARAEKRRDAPLDIAGPQASYLHVDRDRQKPITRNSIVQGLYAFTSSLLQGAATARSAAQQYAQDGPGRLR